MASSVREGATVVKAMEGLADLPRLISVEQASELLGMSRSAGYRAAAIGQIPTLRLGRRLVVPTPRFLRMLGAIEAEGIQEVVKE